MSSSNCCQVYNCPEWIEKNRCDFMPPVCNKTMFSDQLKVFYIGGPNCRKDFHLECGEEVFYQIEGGMILKVVEQGKHRDIEIKQGEIFLLPGKIEHSPQRSEGTVGNVIEREREKDEMDCLRYFIDGTTDVLYERWFHLKDVVKDLPPIIKEFNESEEAKTGKPGPKAKLQEPAYETDKSKKLADPIDLTKFINDNLAAIEKAPFQLYGQPEYRTTVNLIGKGKHQLETGKGDLVVMPQRGEAILRCDGKDHTLGPFHMTRILANKTAELEVKDDAVVVTVRMTR
jgi:3-hydroxyanthranilate 3,4-dioxygenase